MAGVDLTMGKELMGHKYITMTLGYAPTWLLDTSRLPSPPWTG
jgi:hypothetical protein